MHLSDLCGSCIIGYGCSPSRCGPGPRAASRTNRKSARSERDPSQLGTVADPADSQRSHSGAAFIVFDVGLPFRLTTRLRSVVFAAVCAGRLDLAALGVVDRHHPVADDRRFTVKTHNVPGCDP
jgi:hypothetical protein